MLFWKQTNQFSILEFIYLGAERYGHLGVEWPTRCVSSSIFFLSPPSDHIKIKMQCLYSGRNKKTKKIHHLTLIISAVALPETKNYTQEKSQKKKKRDRRERKKKENPACLLPCVYMCFSSIKLHLWEIK